MREQMMIRKATYSETDEILTHSLEVIKEAAKGYVEPSEEKARQMVSPFLTDGGYYLVYIEGNLMKGWIGIGIMLDFYSDEMVGIIPEIYVFPPYRHQGIAEKLCLEGFKHLKEQGLTKVQLNVFEGNRAKDLYRKLGFQEISTLMVKKLK